MIRTLPDKTFFKKTFGKHVSFRSKPVNNWLTFRLHGETSAITQMEDGTIHFLHGVIPEGFKDLGDHSINNVPKEVHHSTFKNMTTFVSDMADVDEGLEFDDWASGV
jgi:hypothetical protein